MNVKEVCESLNKSMKGLGTDEGRLIKEIATHTNSQRQLIKQQYLTMYGKTLEEHIKSEISGNFLTGVLALLVPSDEYDAICVEEAIKGAGTNERVLVQTLCTKDPSQIGKIKAAYKKCKI